MEFMSKLVRAIGGTVVCLAIVYALVILIGSNFDQSDTWILVCFSIVILFAIFFCTYTVLDEIKKHFKDEDDDDDDIHP